MHLSLVRDSVSDFHGWYSRVSGKVSRDRFCVLVLYQITVVKELSQKEKLSMYHSI